MRQQRGPNAGATPAGRRTWSLVTCIEDGHSHAVADPVLAEGGVGRPVPRPLRPAHRAGRPLRPRRTTLSPVRVIRRHPHVGYGDRYHSDGGMLSLHQSMTTVADATIFGPVHDNGTFTPLRLCPLPPPP